MNIYRAIPVGQFVRSLLLIYFSLSPRGSVQSLPELMYGEPSCMSILTTPISCESLECKEKTLQCNLDSEIGKNFLMFDDEVFSKVLMPRREKHCRVYEIEDVTSRFIYSKQ